MKSALVVAAALAVCAGITHAQTVELRLVERKGRATVTGSSDAQLDFAVQARSLGPPNLGVAGVSFNIRFVGEAEANGVLLRGQINYPDHTYTSAIGVSNTIGEGGLASQYAYLAGINGAFNGSINVSSGTFTNTPDQEIGLVSGSTLASNFLSVPGMDLNADGNPDTWGSGVGATPPQYTIAPMPPAIMQEYFGSGAHWIDVYRFRYTVTNFAPRTLDVRIEHGVGQMFAQAGYTGTTWGAGLGFTATMVTASNMLIGVGNPVPGACCTTSGACVIQLASSCTGQYLGAAACAPNACSNPIILVGGCCNSDTGGCSITPWNACQGVFSGMSACRYCLVNPQDTGACCTPSGQCTVITSGCAHPYYDVPTCSPNPCPIPLASGACCRSGTGDCIATLAGQCAGLYQSGIPCFPSPCTATPGACCDLTTGQCNLVTHTACTGYFLAAAACTPNPCPAPLTAGACCDSGRCTLTVPAACTIGIFSGASTCGPATCQTVAACCDWSTGTCVVILSTACVGPPPGAATCTSNPCPVPPTGVQFRIVERAGRSLVSGPDNNQLDLAVQVRVVNAAATVGLAGFGFTMRIVGEPESSGTLAREVISNTDHTYSTGFTLGNTVGIAGLASQYSYLASVNQNFNGLINTTGGTFTNTPDQEIGLIAGQTTGGVFLGTPGIDSDADGNPDTWPGSGSGSSPVNNTRAILGPSVSPTYFGAAGHWIDVYRFRYTISDFAPRSLIFRISAATSSIFSQVALSNGQWAPWTAQTTAPTASDLVIGVIDAVPGACCNAAASCTLTLRTQCSGAFLAAASCAPDPCATPDPTGACCDGTGACTLTLATQCEGLFMGAPSCSPSPCPPGGAPLLCCIGACCRSESCSVSTAASCAAAGNGVFRGAGVSCGPDAGFCCPANFNGVGGVNFQDVVDFVSAWFAADPRADFNTVNGLEVQDIFDFLNAWLAGC
jgi:hypothetical protein